MLLLLFNDPVVSDSLLYHGMLPSRPPCPSPSPGVCPSSCSLHCWCHAAISSSDTLFSFCTQSPSIRDFSNELSVCIRWPKYQSFSFNISHSSERSGFILLKIDWFDLLAVQGTFRSLLQHHSSKASILWHSAFFMVQLSQPYVTTGKTIALTIWTLVGRVMPLLFNTLTRFVIAFLPRSNHLLISWLQSPSTMILEPKKKKSVTTSSFSLSICHALMGQDDMILVFFFFNLNLFILIRG